MNIKRSVQICRPYFASAKNRFQIKCFNAIFVMNIIIVRIRSRENSKMHFVFAFKVNVYRIMALKRIQQPGGSVIFAFDLDGRAYKKLLRFLELCKNLQFACPKEKFYNVWPSVQSPGKKKPSKIRWTKKYFAAIEWTDCSRSVSELSWLRQSFVKHRQVNKIHRYGNLTLKVINCRTLFVRIENENYSNFLFGNRCSFCFSKLIRLLIGEKCSSELIRKKTLWF